MVVLEKLKVEIFEQEKNQPIHQRIYQVLRSSIITHNPSHFFAKDPRIREEAQ